MPGAVNDDYEQLLARIMAEGSSRPDRTGTGTQSLFGTQLRYDLSQGFPLLTTKKVHLKSVVVELLWFLRGESNIGYLHDHGVTIWDEWADADGELGPVYGVQWRSWSDGERTVDQITELIAALKRDPYSRRHIVSAWNVARLPEMALAPCHVLFQFYVADGKLSCQVYQRSADVFLGVPFNIASYALLVHLVAREVGLGVGDLIWVGGDTHLYSNHVEQAKTQLSRDPFPFPQLQLAPAASIFDVAPGDVTVLDYVSHGSLPAPVAV